jgi:hypothetical protein
MWCILHGTYKRQNELSRLGRLACSDFCLCDALDGVFGEGSGELGELEYDDGEDPASAWIGRWRCSGIVMDVGVLSIDDNCLAERGVGCVPKRLQDVEWRWASACVRTAATAAGGTCRAAGEVETMNSNRQRCKIKDEYKRYRQTKRGGGE